MHDRTRIKGLDGIRGIAAVLVVVAHHYASPDWSGAGVLHFIQLTLSGGLAVSAFFTLSAFLLVFLLVREHDRTGTISCAGFFARRVRRIMPLYFAGLFAAIWLAPPQNTPGIEANLWRYLTFTSNWGMAQLGRPGAPDLGTSAMDILWSIAVEMQFYLVVPFLCAWLLRASPARRVGLILAIVAAAFGFRLWMFLAVIPTQDLIPKPAIYYATFSYLGLFLIGGAAGWMVARKAAPRVPGAAALALFATASALWRQVLLDGGSAAYLVAQPAAALAFSAALLWLTQNPHSRVTRALDSRVFVTLGALSYGIYVWHVTSRQLYVPWFSRWRQDLPVDAFETLNFLLSVSAAVLVSAVGRLVIERPFLARSVSRRASLPRTPPTI